MMSPTNHQIMDNAIYESHVSPGIVRHLALAGLDCTGLPYNWRIKGEVCILKCSKFDNDNYYAQSDKLIDEMFPADFYLPAFQIKDLEKLLPDFIIERRNNKYTVAILNIYNVEAVSNERLPDAVALMVLDCIRAKIIKPDIAVKHILSAA